MMHRTKKKGFSLTEIVIVIIIIGILALIGTSVGSTQISKARINTVSNNMKLVSSEVENAIVDLGFLESIDDEVETRSYFNTWNRKYLTPNIDSETIVIVPAGGMFGANFSGVYIETKNYEDPWDNQLRIYYMIPTVGEEYRIIIASAGPNSQFAPDAANGYINLAFDDDVVMVMEPRFME